MNERPPIFHIGLPKTGSTYLQRRVFPAIPNADYFSSDDDSLPEEFGWVYRLNGPWLANRTSREVRRKGIESIFKKEKQRLLAKLRQQTADSRN